MLIIQREHLQNGHSGKECTLTDLRQKYWITNGRIIMKSLINKCLRYKENNAQSSPPFMADLPLTRLGMSMSPFTYTDVDYFDLIQIKQGRLRLKRWGSLFVCMTTRTIHLEIPSLWILIVLLILFADLQIDGVNLK